MHGPQRRHGLEWSARRRAARIAGALLLASFVGLAGCGDPEAAEEAAAGEAVRAPAEPAAGSSAQSAAAEETASPHAGAAESASGVDWQEWSAAVFERAQAENRFVLLDLGAVWCHWCHVMDRETYSDPAIQKALADAYIAVRVDQDSRPDLAVRYERYGWPATIIFGPDGTEIAKRRGFLPPDVLLSVLEAVVEDATPVPGIELVLPDRYARESQLSEAARDRIEAFVTQTLDTGIGGLRFNYRFMSWDTVEWALVRALEGDEELRTWADLSLESARKLIDPVWGGAYQYSVNQSWDEPHYEKIMQFQAENLRVHALAAVALDSEREVQSVEDMRRYVQTFLTSFNGGFYTSQDADVVPGEPSEGYWALGRAEREAIGIPRVDENQYARENGWMIEAMATAYEMLGTAEDLAQAEQAALWAMANRALPGGGFRHGESDPAGPYLGDTLAMARGFLQLYRATAEKIWLERAIESAGFIEEHFRREAAGYVSARGDETPIEAVPHFDQNVRLVRFANLLHHYSGEEAHRSMAEHGFRYVATEDVQRGRGEMAGVLLADRELASDPLHLTIVGSKAERSSRLLHAAALRQPGWYKRVEWWDPAEGPLVNMDVQYPELDRPAAFVCDARTCSRPLFEAAEIGEFLASRAPAQAAGAEGPNAED